MSRFSLLQDEHKPQSRNPLAATMRRGVEVRVLAMDPHDEARDDAFVQPVNRLAAILSESGSGSRHVSMSSPSWFADWQSEAFDELRSKNSRMQEEFGLGRWDRFDYDLPTGTLRFSERGVTKVVADIQIAGTTSVRAGNWLWAWANDEWPVGLTEASRRALHFGNEHGICDLMHELVDADDYDLNALGWDLTAAATRLSGALGAYRPPRDEGGGLYLMITDAQWAG